MKIYFKKLFFFIIALIFNILFYTIFNFQKILNNYDYYLGLFGGIFLIYIIIFSLLNKISKKFTVKAFFLYSILLAFSDQILKFVIHKGVIKETTLLNGVLYIRNTLTAHTSYLLNFFNIKIDVFFIVFLKTMILILFYYIYRLFKKELFKVKENIFWLNFGWIFILGGLVSSIFDSIIWNATLDFIYIYNFFHIDLKDLFVDLGMYSLLVNCVYLLYYNKNNKINLLKLIKKLYFLFKQDVDKIFKKFSL